MKVSIPLLATIAAFITGVPAQADSFLPPSVQEASSADGSIVVTVVPAMLSCAVGEADCEPAARAIVEHFRGDYRSNSRTVRLLNPQAPARVLVTDDGERLLTVDDYASYGFGENVLVVYGSKGEVIARHALPAPGRTGQRYSACVSRPPYRPGAGSRYRRNRKSFRHTLGKRPELRAREQLAGARCRGRTPTRTLPPTLSLSHTRGGPLAGTYTPAMPFFP